ncbi:MAG: hypothetical protein AAGH40_12270 [Verrucomicrobiota bacterium]
MKELILSYQGRAIPLHHLSAQLNSLMNILISVDPGFKNSLFREWMVIEEINALALDSGKEDVMEEHKTILDGSLRKLLTLLAG